MTTWLLPDRDAIPDLLRQQPRWLLWKASPAGKKVPYPAGDPHHAVDGKNPVNWCRFDEATFVYIRGGFDGIGFALGETNNGLTFSGIDLDGCRNPQTGEIDGWARAIIRDINTYTEVSPSGKGVKLFVTGSLPPGARQRKRYKVELYDRGRYFAVTGHHLPGTPAVIEPREEALRSLHTRLWTSTLLGLVKLFGLYRNDAGDKVCITCPWADEHTTPDDETTTVLFVTDGKITGFNCQHAHCADRHLPEVVKLFGLDDHPTAERTLRLTPVSQIEAKPVYWFWHDRLPAGELTLIAGREGLGKSLSACMLAALTTRGQLPGEYHGTPRHVIVAAAEDSWEHTMRPRLEAARADLDLVSRVDVVTTSGSTQLVLPTDLPALETLIVEQQTALLVLDPLISRLDRKLDSHNDAEVRTALEPLAQMAQRTGVCIIGIIHVNKTRTSDILNTIMASRAFTAVPRAILVVMRNPDDEGVRLLGEPKNNLGRTDLPTLKFRIVEAIVGTSADGRPITTGQLVWDGEDERTVQEVAEQITERPYKDRRTASKEAGDWLLNFLRGQDGWAWRKTIEAQATFSASALRRAKLDLKIGHSSVGPKRETVWWLPGQEPTPLLTVERPIEESVQL